MQHAEIGSTHMSFCSLKLVTDLETAFGISFKYVWDMIIEILSKQLTQSQ